MAEQQEIVDTFLRKLEDSPYVMIGLDDTPDHSQPMYARFDKDDGDTLWFFTQTDNRLSMGGPAMAQFVAKGHDFFACLHGTLTPDNDRATIDRFWNSYVEAWYDERGKDDPKLLLMRYTVQSAELWETDISLTGRVKMLFGGTIRPDESSSHAKVDSLHA